MTRLTTILIAILVLIGSFLFIRYIKDSYRLLPFNEKNPLDAGSNKPLSNFLNWKEFNHTDGTFTALFPVLPQHVTDKIADPITKESRKYDMYAAADENGTGYLVSTTTFPEKIDPKNVEIVLRSAVNDMLSRNKDNKLKITKAGKFNDSDSLDFALENNQVKVAGKAIIHDNILYVLSMADQSADFNNEELTFFINSFQILEKDINSQNPKSPPSKSNKMPLLKKE
jgi:hypothetical protein